jgi:dienelactone hydrolase
MSKIRKAVLVVLALALLGAGGTFGHLRGWWVESRTPAELSALLRPHDRIFVPDGPGPFPTLIFFHGCGGLLQSRLDMAERVRKWGYAVVAVDSIASRNIEEGRNLFGGGQVLGPERAGDALVSLADVRRMDFVDPDRIAMIGWSHGGWTLMEMLAFDPPHGRPVTLRKNPDGGLEGLRSVTLFYPYCGFASLGNRWRAPIPTLFLLGGSDRVARPQPCVEAANALRSDGLPVQLQVFDDSGHGFDVPPAPGETRDPPFDSKIAERSNQHLRDFLSETMREI